MNLRKVSYSEYEQENKQWLLKVKGEAVFHTFGIDCQEFEHGVGTFTTAIIELPDGTLKNLPVEQIKFVPPSE